MLMAAATLGSCVEHRYYREHHRHRPEYYQRRHQPEPRVDIDIRH